jgi:hypothetical protein
MAKRQSAKDKSFAAVAESRYQLWTPEELPKAYESGEIVGWKPDYRLIEEGLKEEEHPVFSIAAHDVIKTFERKTTLLYEHLLYVKPDYKRGAQGIGSCVGWGLEMALTLLTAKKFHAAKKRDGFVEVATEACYGGSRCEALGKTFGGWSDGAFGYAAAKFAKNFGAVYRKDYSQETGSADDNLTVYNVKKEKDWGAYGCGGQDDKGLLDAIARTFPVKTISQVRSFEDVAACIAGAKCPVTIASMYGTDMRRDQNGMCRWNKRWPHQMCLAGVRFDPDAALCFQSWGPKSASGPKWPVDMPDNIAGFSWWIPASEVTRICQDDCWAIGDVEGWQLDTTDYTLWD